MGRDEERVAYYGPRGYEGEPVPRRLRRMAARLRRQAAAGVWPGCRTYHPEDDVPDLSEPRQPHLCTDHHHGESEAPT